MELGSSLFTVGSCSIWALAALAISGCGAKAEPKTDSADERLTRLYRTVQPGWNRERLDASLSDFEVRLIQTPKADIVYVSVPGDSEKNQYVTAVVHYDNKIASVNMELSGGRSYGKFSPTASLD